MNYREAEEYIFRRRRMGMKFGLDRAARLLREAGDPQKSFRTVHIVGTNGKGSTTAFLSKILMESGFRVGRMISPHLLNYRERIAVNGRWIPEDAVVEYLETFRKTIEECSATFFEITTAMSAWYFEKAGVELVAAEAGLGGRLDATRLLKGEMTIFTGVELEHRRILGPTEAAITGEKVAIAERGTHLLAYSQAIEVESVINAAVKENQLKRLIPDLPGSAPLPGEHQLRNCGLALLAASLVTGEPSASLQKKLSDFHWTGRIDLRHGDPEILFDVAHNPGSMEQLLMHIKQNYETPVPAVLGFLADKFWRRMLDQIRGILDPVIATTPLNERKLSAERLALELMKRGFSARAEEDVGRAIKLGRETGGGPLVVTGSFFVTGEAMLIAWREGWILPPEPDEEPAQLPLFTSGS